MLNYAVVEDATNLVVNTIVWDGETEYSPDKGFSLVQSDVAGIGWTYGPDGFTPPPAPEPVPPTFEEALASATAERDRLLAMATLAIAPLQDAVDLDDATDEESAILKKWKQYRVALNRIQDQKGFPKSFDWPVKPQ